MIIHYTSSFLKEFKSLPKNIKELAIQQEMIFKANPLDPRLPFKVLKGRLKGLSSF